MGPLFVISLLITFTLGQQYIYVNEWLTYSEAQAYCMTHYSATLAVFDTIDEASSLQTTIPSNESPARAFIGLDALGDYNTWEMADDDITQNWCSGDCDANSPVYWGITPSNPASNGACAVIRRLHFPLSQSIIQWPCDDRQRFICNKDPVTSKAPTAPTAPTIPQPSISPTQVPSKSPTSTTICCTCTNSRSGPGCSEDTACTNTVCNDDAFCCNSYWDSICGDLALNVCNSTPSPSISPSVEPSKPPSRNPTSTAPTSNPSSEPSISPSVPAPTVDPTVNPSYHPSISPTTTAPTFDPTNNPSNNPTMQPSMDPTYGPSLNPTAAPSMYTLNPSDVPTSNPTAIVATNTPSLSPTTTAPTSNPTEITTMHPSTQSPSISPTATISDAFISTQTPSVNPTIYPSTYPTSSPSSNPTENPTSQPSDAPIAGKLSISMNDGSSESITTTATVPGTSGNPGNLKGQPAKSDKNDSVASAMFGSYTDAILLTLSSICICCTVLILVVFCLKRRKDLSKAQKDISNIEMTQNDTESTENRDGGRESGTLESAIEGNGVDENVRNRGGTFDSVQSQTISNTNLNPNPQQMVHQQSLPDYSQNMSMQQAPYLGSYSAAQNYLNISYANGVNSNSYQGQYGSYSNQYNPSMNNGNPLILSDAPSNVSAFSQYSKPIGPLIHNNPLMQSSQSVHQGQAQLQAHGQIIGFPQQRLPLNGHGAISLPVLGNKIQKQNKMRSSSDANSEIGDTPGLHANVNEDIIGIDEEKEFEYGLHVIDDHNQDANSENSDATSEEGIDVIHGDDPATPATPDDDMWGVMNECDIVTAGGGTNNGNLASGEAYKNALRESGIRNFMNGKKIKNRNMKKNVRFNMHVNNDSVYNEDDAQSVIGYNTDIGELNDRI